MGFEYLLHVADQLIVVPFDLQNFLAELVVLAVEYIHVGAAHTFAVEMPIVLLGILVVGCIYVEAMHTLVAVAVLGMVVEVVDAVLLVE